MKKFAIIVAGGSGKRMAAQVPKQFLPLNGKPILMHTLEAFHAYDADLQLVLVLPETQLVYWIELCEQHHFALPHAIAFGGKERYDSVKNGLLMVQQLRGPQQGSQAEKALVAVHDAVRPFVDNALLERCYAKAAEVVAVVPVQPLVESLRRLKPDGGSQAEDRSQFCHVQTPQVFDADALWEAYKRPYQDDFTDDASVMEAAGYTISLVDGWRRNIKITTQEDLDLANFWKSCKTQDNFREAQEKGQKS